MADHIEIAVVENLADDDLEQVEMLLSQLSTSATFDPGRVQSMVDVPGVDLFVARDGGRIVGMATLELTSRPERESALKLYESVGFRPRETNVLRYTQPPN